MKKLLIVLLISIIGSIFFGCQKIDIEKHLFFGSKKDLGNGTVRSYAVVEEHNRLKTIGFTFSENALEGLDTKSMGTVIILDVPSRIAGMGYDHLEIDWNPNGHEPAGIYDLPHFDFHFYLVGIDELAAIVPGPDLTPVEPQYIPKDYISGVDAVPNMGVHWIDSQAPELHGITFTTTFIYGFYHGKMLFTEPMVTKAFLETHPDVTMPVKQPEAFQKHGWYPTKYRVAYSNHQYFVSLEGLKYH